MTGQRGTTSRGAGSRWQRRGRLLLIGILLLAALIVSTGYVLLSPSVMGRLWERPRPPSLRVDNRTDHTILLYDVWVDGSEHRMDALAPPIAPRTSVQTGITCAADELVARTKMGGLVERRGPFRDCNVETWVIERMSG
jgi:hypothetical protein